MSNKNGRRNIESFGERTNLLRGQFTLSVQYVIDSVFRTNLIQSR